MTEIEIGRAKRGRRAYSFDDIAIVPSRRTRDPEEVSTAWQIDAYRFDIPVLAAPMDSVMSPSTAISSRILMTGSSIVLSVAILFGFEYFYGKMFPQPEGNQPVPTAGYTIFTAEVASPVNETLLTWHLLGQAKDEAERFAVLHFALLP